MDTPTTVETDMPRIITVIWADAMHPAGEWSSPDSLADYPALIYSCGYEVKRTDTILWVAASIDLDDTGAVVHVSGEMGIPINMILSEREVA